MVMAKVTGLVSFAAGWGKAWHSGTERQALGMGIPPQMIMRRFPLTQCAHHSAEAIALESKTRHLGRCLSNIKTVQQWVPCDVVVVVVVVESGGRQDKAE